ncbi:DoxX family protein [Nocardia sp. CDC186]|uniref:DoxX family protein n=1 Tax=Nocardia implantans TaxID=3108168 RepID=A0ABU6AT84_9NOCA|nr:MULTISPECIES: DoxX family protein [unclassified Nocardia]MBF6191021.1 DoxX family protein [Nocardia beijingensis]MEA3529016.1 DoxX family protein [Nocardia sp. CDC192]MEB3510681.1 DoxX family protein [Nocardia sp. CDC186]
MTDKPKDTPEAKAGDATPTTAEQVAVSSTGRGVTSPYDSPTEQFERVDPAQRPQLSKDVPRTEEELGLDPDVPATGASKPPAGATAAPTYDYASIPPAPTPPSETARLRRRNGEVRRGTLDLGLLLLRLVVGATFLYHGLQKLTGWFHGPGLDGTRDMMERGGWDHPSVSAILVTAGEVGGGALLILGLFTPLAAGAVLAVILDAWAWKQGMAPGFQYKAGPGAVEFESVLAGVSAAIILTGPGRLSFDRSRGWAIRPAAGSFVILLLAVAAAAGAYWYLHGGNPLTGIGPFD